MYGLSHFFIKWVLIEITVLLHRHHFHLWLILLHWHHFHLRLNQKHLVLWINFRQHFFILLDFLLGNSFYLLHFLFLSFLLLLFLVLIPLQQLLLVNVLVSVSKNNIFVNLFLHLVPILSVLLLFVLNHFFWDFFRFFLNYWNIVGQNFLVDNINNVITYLALNNMFLLISVVNELDY